MRHQTIDILQTHALFDSTLHAHQANPVLVFQQFTDRPYPTIAEVVDVINSTLAVAQINQITNNLKNVFLGQGGQIQGIIKPQLMI